MPTEDGAKSKLSLHSSNQDKSAEKISIFIKKCKNLVTAKPEGLTVYLQLDYNDAKLSESPKIHITPDNLPEFNFNTNLYVNTQNEMNSMDDLAHKPIVVTLIEVLPKEKKQKEEKVQVVGQATFDLLALIKGETEISFKAPVMPTPGSSLEQLPSDALQVRRLWIFFFSFLKN